MPVAVTHHAVKRCRKRLGLPKRAVTRNAERAFAEGRQHGDFTGSFKRYLDRVHFKDPSVNQLRVFGGTLFLFADGVLITAWPVPPKFRKIAERK